MKKFFVLCVAWGIAQCAKPRRTSSKFHANNENNVKNLQCSKYSNTLRRIAGCVLVIFVGASMHDYVYAHMNIPVDTIHTLILPSELGNVVERYTGTTNEKVIVINDIHCDPETQRTISNIIITAKQVYGKHLRLIGIEGTRTGVIDTSIIRDIPNTRMRTDVTNYFVDRGDISGGELYAIATRDDVAVVGLEEPLLYRRNFNALYRSLAYRDSISQMCATIRRNIAPLKHYVYTDYARAIEQMQHAFDNGTVNAETYFSYLKTQAEKQNIDFRKRFPYIHTALQSYAIQKKINMPMVATEMRHLIAQLDAVLTNRERDALAILQKQGAASYYGYACELLSKKRVQWNTQYPQVQLYCSYLDCMRRVDAVKIMNESNACVQLLMAQALETRRDGQMLAGCEHYADAMESYICNTACQTDVETFMQQRSALFRVVHEVEERMMREHTITEHAAMLTAADATMDEFYVCAAQRNDVMTRLLLEQSRAVHSTVSVCIVGGFHREGITRALKSRGISYDVVIPVMNTNHESKWYVRRIKEQQLKMASFDKRKDVGLVAMRQSGVETAHFDNESVKKHNPLSMSHKGASLTSPFSKGEWEDALMVETNFGDGRFESVVFKQVCESVAQIKDIEVMRNFFEYYKPRLWDGVRITKSETEITFQVTKVTNGSPFAATCSVGVDRLDDDPFFDSIRRVESSGSDVIEEDPQGVLFPLSIMCLVMGGCMLVLSIIVYYACSDEESVRVAPEEWYRDESHVATFFWANTWETLRRMFGIADPAYSIRAIAERLHAVPERRDPDDAALTTLFSSTEQNMLGMDDTHLTVSVRQNDALLAIVTEEHDGHVTTDITSGMMMFLQRLHSLIVRKKSRDYADACIAECAYHEADELLRLRRGDIPDVAHLCAVFTSGNLQRALCDNCTMLQQLWAKGMGGTPMTDDDMRGLGRVSAALTQCFSREFSLELSDVAMLFPQLRLPVDIRQLNRTMPVVDEAKLGRVAAELQTMEPVRAATQLWGNGPEYLAKKAMYLMRPDLEKSASDRIAQVISRIMHASVEKAAAIVKCVLTRKEQSHALFKSLPREDRATLLTELGRTAETERTKSDINNMRLSCAGADILEEGDGSSVVSAAVDDYIASAFASMGREAQTVIIRSLCASGHTAFVAEGLIAMVEHRHGLQSRAQVVSMMHALWDAGDRIMVGAILVEIGCIDDSKGVKVFSLLLADDKAQGSTYSALET